MKNLIYILIAFFLFFSCKKEELSDRFTRADLTEHDWIITSQIVKYNTQNPFAVTSDLITVEEVWNIGTECFYDDVYQFKINGEFQQLNGQDGCGYILTANWEILTSGTLRIYSDLHNLHRKYLKHGSNFLEIYHSPSSSTGSSLSVTITRFEHY